MISRERKSMYILCINDVYIIDSTPYKDTHVFQSISIISTYLSQLFDFYNEMLFLNFYFIYKITIIEQLTLNNQREIKFLIMFWLH